VFLESSFGDFRVQLQLLRVIMSSASVEASLDLQDR
jgi:hypothetical protein